MTLHPPTLSKACLPPLPPHTGSIKTEIITALDKHGAHVLDTTPTPPSPQTTTRRVASRRRSLAAAVEQQQVHVVIAEKVCRTPKYLFACVKVCVWCGGGLLVVCVMVVGCAHANLHKHHTWYI